MTASRPLQQLAADLPGAAFAYVMATGVVSIGMHLVHQQAISLVLWWLAGAGWVVLTVLTLVRVATDWTGLLGALRNGTTAFGYFTLVAGTCVLGIRFAVAGMVPPALALWLIGVVLWAVTGYAVPWLVVLHAHRLGRPGTTEGTGPRTDLVSQVDGTWFVWVVATQSVAILGAFLVPHLGQLREVATVAVLVAWASGLGLYLVVATGLVVRILREGIGVQGLGPSFWVVMGALAISTLAAGRIADLPGDGAAAQALHPVATGISLVAWGLATWLVPGLLALGIWRYVRRHVPASYVTALWAMVFPLGVYSVASLTVGSLVKVPQIGWAGHGMIWLALAAWTFVALDWVISRWRARVPSVRT